MDEEVGYSSCWRCFTLFHNPYKNHRCPPTVSGTLQDATKHKTEGNEQGMNVL